MSLEEKTKRWRPSRRGFLAFGLGVALTLLVFLVVHLVHNAQVPLRPASYNVTISWLPDTVTHWSPQIAAAGQKYNIDPNFIAIIMTLESGGDAKAQSGSDAVGLMQVTPLTGKDIANKYLKKPQRPLTNYDLKDPITSLDFGTAYLAWLRDQFGTVQQGPDWNSTVELVAAGYNGGPGAANSLEQGKGLTDTQTVVYSRDAFNMWRERHASDSPTFDRWKERGGQALLDSAKADQ